MSLERRHYPRKPFRARGLLAEKGSTAIEIYTIDISIGGLCISASNQLMVGQSYTISFDVTLSGKSRRVAAITEVAYSVGSSKDGFKTGLRFVDIDDASSALIEELLKE